MVNLEKIHITVAEYLNLPETNLPSELINGEMITMPAPTGKHQIVLGNVHFYLRKHQEIGQFIFAPADVRLGDNIVQPDLFWIAPSNESIIFVEERYWENAPDLIIEILSPSTAKRDRDEKFKLYQASGVREYWLVELDAEFVEVYVLQAGKYERQGIYDVNDTFSSPTLGLSEIDVKAFF